MRNPAVAWYLHKRTESSPVPKQRTRNRERTKVTSSTPCAPSPILTKPPAHLVPSSPPPPAPPPPPHLARLPSLRRKHFTHYSLAPSPPTHSPSNLHRSLTERPPPSPKRLDQRTCITHTHLFREAPSGECARRAPERTGTASKRIPSYSLPPLNAKRKIPAK